MLRHKIAFVIFIIICSCENSNNAAFFLPDTTKINYWKKNYDSLYTLYRQSKKVELLYKAGVFADSILSYNSVLKKDTGLQKIYLTTLFYRAINLNDLGYFVKSRELFDKYIPLFQEYNLSEHKRLAYAQKTLGNIYSRYGDYKKAVLLLQQSLAYYNEAKDTLEVSSTILNLSIPLKELKRYTEAAKTLQQIFLLPTVAAKRKAKACIELADIYVRQNKITEAGLQIQKAKQFLTGISGIADVYASLYSVEGDWQMLNKKPVEALVAYNRSLDSLKVASAQNLRSREIGKTYIAMGKALEQLHYSDSALVFYNKALYTVIDVDTLNKFSLPRQKDIYAENTIAEALYARANCIINRKTENTTELENAVSCYKLAFAAEGKLLNAFSYDESRLYLVEQTRKHTEKAIGICYQLYKKTNSPQWANQAFLFAENNKAFVLAQSVQRNTAASIFLQSDTLYKKMQQLQSNLAVTEIELGKQHFLAQPDTALQQSLNATKQKLEESLLAAENNIRIKNPQYTVRLSGNEVTTATEILNNTLAVNTALVEYFCGDSSLYAFSTQKNKALNFYKLPGSLKTSTSGFLYFFSNKNLILNNPVQYAAAASNLYQALLYPYLPKDAEKLLIIPDGFVAAIPFDALLTNTTASTNIAAFPFLIKQQEIFYAFSCKTLLAKAQLKHAQTKNTLVAFAPVFTNKERGLMPLLHSAAELGAIKQFYPQGKFFSGSTATLSSFEANSGNASIIHLATHAGPGTDTIPAYIELYDSSVYLNTIYTKKFTAKLVVLSGCQTGAGIINKTEGPMSLARGFSYAGTKNVIASLWQTEDNSSSEIFRNFYGNLSANNFSSSLHKAKLSFLGNSSVAAASPYYWSGYIYIGTPEESLAPQSPYKLILIAVAASLLLMIGYFIFKRRRRQKLVL